MSEQNFVSTHGGTDILSQGSGAITEPTLNTTALKDAAKALLNKPAANPAPAAPPQGQPSRPQVSAVPSTSASPVQQIPISVSDASSKAQPAGEEQAALEGQKVTVTDSQGQKTEIDLLSIPDDAVVKMKVNGQETIVSGKEAREFGMRGAKFTQEMQQLRAREAEFATRLEQAGVLEQLITNESALAEYIYAKAPHIVEQLAQHMGYTKAEAAQAMAQQVQQQAAPAPVALPPNFNPGELASLGEVNELLGQTLAQREQAVLEQVRKELGGVNTTVEGLVKQQVRNAVQAELQLLRNATEIQQFDTEIVKTVDGILTANPALKAVPNIEKVLRFEVAKMRPKSPEEMIEAFNHVASGIVEGLEQTYNTARKTAVIDKATMEKTGIEPPVGAAPTFTRPINYADQNTGKVDWKLIRQAARAALG
jgi:hypothetical protein